MNTSNTMTPLNGLLLNRIPSSRQIWRHYLGRIYEVLGIGGKNIPIPLRDIDYLVKDMYSDRVLGVYQCSLEELIIVEPISNVVCTYPLVILQDKRTSERYFEIYDNFLQQVQMVTVDNKSIALNGIVIASTILMPYTRTDIFTYRYERLS